MDTSAKQGATKLNFENILEVESIFESRWSGWSRLHPGWEWIQVIRLGVDRVCCAIHWKVVHTTDYLASEDYWHCRSGHYCRVGINWRWPGGCFDHSLRSSDWWTACTSLGEHPLNLQWRFVSNTVSAGSIAKMLQVWLSLIIAIVCICKTDSLLLSFVFVRLIRAVRWRLWPIAMCWLQCLHTDNWKVIIVIRGAKSWLIETRLDASENDCNGKIVAFKGLCCLLNFTLSFIKPTLMIISETPMGEWHAGGLQKEVSSKLCSESAPVQLVCHPHLMLPPCLPVVINASTIITAINMTREMTMR